MQRWWIYQQERFPLAAHGILIALFTWSAISYTASVGQGNVPINVTAGMTAFVVIFGFFMQLRIADEFKDKEQDACHRPYRPVPRGLVSLKELAVIAVLIALIQMLLTLCLDPGLLIVLLAVWIWMGLMTLEFGSPAWLHRHPVIYLISHMMIMPFISFYASACYWLPTAGIPGEDLLPILALSFTTGLVYEIGRKIRTRTEEEPGVETYSRLWGLHLAVYVWWGAITFTLLCAVVIALRLQTIVLITSVSVAIGIYGLISGWRLLHNPVTGSGTAIKSASGLMMLIWYLIVGLAASLPILREYPL